MKNVIRVSLVLLVLLLSIVTVYAEDSLEVVIPEFPVTFNGVDMNPAYSEYPLFVYKGITYVPMTYNASQGLGLSVEFSGEKGLSINPIQANGTIKDYTKAGKNPSQMKAIRPSYKIAVNNKLVDNASEDYPILSLNDVTYFPLTWKWVNDEFGWEISFSNEAGLKIESSLSSVKEETTSIEVERQYASGEVIKVEKNPDAGFFWPYYLYIPKNLSDDKTYIFVEPNNQPNKDVAFSQTEESAYGTAMHNIQYAESLGMPVLVPVFPGTNDITKVTPEYYHALNTPAVLDDEEIYKRVDLQLLKMVEDARDKLSGDSIETYEKIIINGFSDSGNFSNRFTAIHPDKVKLMVAGGINVFLYPTDKYDGVDFEYPLGTADYEKLFDKAFDHKAYDQVAKFIYRGGADESDPIYGTNFMTKEVKNFIINHLAKDISKRLDISKEIYEEGTDNLQFVIYEGIEHTITEEIREDIIKFIKTNIEGDFKAIEPSDHKGKLAFMEGMKSAYYLGGRTETQYAIKKISINGPGTGAMNADPEILADADLVFLSVRNQNDIPALLSKDFSDLVVTDKDDYIKTKYEDGKVYILLQATSETKGKELIDTIKVEQLISQ
ncbi:hypothetical protein EZV73_20690 [Acidaminobacter sp. JC074]|uniref:hypothetical protein n=1 Tax=Acidaminobacter sp. JC074 TaxID=2530199 RepID=UPI001F0CE764|nr:hypothetical protein [Acidaminobacter sp. JC074]MCH4890009.1 hypothetical protein [Acidaminobacter sp. JC074]